jgi:hypothetical protein
MGNLKIKFQTRENKKDIVFEVSSSLKYVKFHINLNIVVTYFEIIVFPWRRLSCLARFYFYPEYTGSTYLHMNNTHLFHFTGVSVTVHYFKSISFSKNLL